MAKKQRKIHTSYRPFFRFVRKIAKAFKKKPKALDLNKSAVEEPAIYISNHSGASGPLTLSLYIHKFIVPWGTYEMVGNYLERWKYLYYVFYQQKLGYKKAKSWILATLFGIISKMLYRGMQLIPTYRDIRFKTTISQSLRFLRKKSSVLIFPEDSTTGYHEQLLRYNLGFIFLSETYYKETGIDLPVYPVRYSKQKNMYIIGEKDYVNKYLLQGKSREEVAEIFKDTTNVLGEMILNNKEPAQ
ncbi:MAG: hypothetical protein GX807_02180 [Erysipelotrichia bacterium]|nr:hypothetical protein [Erysipelotrichia bacterium]